MRIETTDIIKFTSISMRNKGSSINASTIMKIGNKKNTTNRKAIPKIIFITSFAILPNNTPAKIKYNIKNAKCSFIAYYIRNISHLALIRNKLYYCLCPLFSQLSLTACAIKFVAAAKPTDNLDAVELSFGLNI